MRLELINKKEEKTDHSVRGSVFLALVKSDSSNKIPIPQIISFYL